VNRSKPVCGLSGERSSIQVLVPVVPHRHIDLHHPGVATAQQV